VMEVLESGWLTMGERTIEFERQFAEFVSARHAVAVNSATAALHLALEAVGVGPSDEVILPTYTFAACAEVVVHLGATPVLADVDPSTLDLTIDTILPRVTPRTKAVLPVHFGGRVSDLGPILEWAAAREVAVIEDAAHALPATRNGRHAGTLGRAGAFSFYATKPVTTGEGGMLVTDDETLADRARLMRLHGTSRHAWRRYVDAGAWHYDIEAAGFKYNTTDLAAALGLVQLRRAEQMRQARAAVATLYNAAMAEPPFVGLVQTPPGADGEDRHAWHLYPLRLNLERLVVDRADVIRSLTAAGVGTSVHFIPLHLHPYYRQRFGYQPADLPVATREYERELSLPIYPDLQPTEQERITSVLGRILSEARRS